MSDITYTWNFNPLRVTYNLDDMTNVVEMVHWQFTGQTGSYSSMQIGTVSLAAPTGSFIAYEELTKEIVQGWVEESMGVDAIAALSASVSTSLALQIAPTQGNLTPPWET